MRTRYTNTTIARTALTLILFIALSNFANASQGLAFSIDIGTYTEAINSERLLGHNYRIETKKNGLMTYIVGEYEDFIVAQRTRIQLKESGFDQAEVVAYFNSDPISMDDAFIMLDKREAYNAAALTASPAVKATSAKAAMPVEELNEILDAYNNEEISFSVQVGAFSTPQALSSFDIPTAVEEHPTNDGKYRYTTGNFIDYTEASTTKQALQSLGVNDAFVVAYKNGQRITVQEALQQR